MEDFPPFMKNRRNLIDPESQYTENLEGYVFDGADGSQMALWNCRSAQSTQEHTHDYDEYFVVVTGQYALRINGKVIVLRKGDEFHITKGISHSGDREAGTRTIHAFGGMNACEKSENLKPLLGNWGSGN